MRGKQNRGAFTRTPVRLQILIVGRRLPATVAAASATITAISSTPAATPATATAATSATAATPASAITATPATATRPSTPASAPTFTRRASFVDDNIAAHEIMAVQTLNGALGFLVAIDLDKPEPAWLPRKTVAHQGNVRRGDARLSK
jgi:hypothetical protein